MRTAAPGRSGVSCSCAADALDVRPAEILLRSRLDAHARSPVRALGAHGARSRMRSATVPIDPAPSVIDDVARPRQLCDRLRQIVDGRDDVHRAAAPRAGPRAASASTVTPAIGVFAGGVDVGQHDLVGAAERRRRTRPSAARRPREAVRLEATTTRRSMPARAARDAPPRFRSDDGRSRRRP